MSFLRRAFLAMLLVVPALAAADLRKPSTYVPGRVWQHRTRTGAVPGTRSTQQGFDTSVSRSSNLPDFTSTAST